MSFTIDKIKFPGITAVPFSGNTPGLVRNILIDTAFLKKTLGKRPEEVLRPVGLRLTKSLASLPEPMVKESAKEELIGILQETDRLADSYDRLIELSLSIFSGISSPNLLDWYTPQSLTSGEPAANGLPPSRSLYEVSASDGHVKPLPKDPPRVGMAGYRIAEVTTLVHLLKYGSPYRLIFVPGYIGTGKKSYVVKEITHRLTKERRKFCSIDMANRYEGFKTLRETLGASPLPSILILREISYLEPDAIRKLINKLLPYYRTKHKKVVVVLMGGGFMSAECQAILFKEEFEGLIKTVQEDGTIVVPIEVKPLNRNQAEEVLTGEASKEISGKSRKKYTDFVLNRVPPYLRALRSFSLSPRTMSLADAFQKFEETFNEEMELIIKNAGLKPTDVRDETEESQSLEKIRSALSSDISQLLGKRLQ